MSEVEHPKHYNEGSIECIEVIEDWDLGFHLGNAVKYICRSKHKGNELKDIEKAFWYLRRYLSILEHEERQKVLQEKADKIEQLMKERFRNSKGK